METYLPLFLQSVAEPVTAALIHSLWQGTLIAGALALVLTFLRRGAAGLRYTIACSALVAMLASGILTVAAHTGSQPLGGRATAASRADGGLPAGSTRAAAGAPEPYSTPPGAALQRARSWIFPVWLLGVLSFSLVHLRGWRRVHRLARIVSREAAPEWRERLACLARRLGVRRRVRLVESAIARVPAVIGCVRPVILVPTSAFTGLSVQHLELVLAHELAHVRRHDVLLNYLQVAVETLFFYHPAAWWISKRIRVEREHCCDDLAVGAGDPLPYARALERLERLRGAAPALAQAADGTSLLARIRRLVAPAARPSDRAGTGLAGLLALWLGLGAGLAGLGGLSFSAASPETRVVGAAEYAPAARDVHGEWTLEEWQDGMHLRVSFPSLMSSTGFTLDSGALAAWSGAGDDGGMRIERDAGTFYLEGRPRSTSGGYRGSGACHFRANPDYMGELARLGISGTDPDKTFTFAIHDVSLEFAAGLVDAGMSGLSLSRLLEFHIHDVSPAFIEELARLGYGDLPGSRLVEMRIHDVTTDFIRDLDSLGYRGIPASRLVEMRIHDVTTDFIRELEQLGYRDVPTSQLVAMCIHDVSPQFIRRMRDEGRDDLSTERLIELKIRGY